MVDVSHSCFVDEIAEISTDSEVNSDSYLVECIIDIASAVFFEIPNIVRSSSYKWYSYWTDIAYEISLLFLYIWQAGSNHGIPAPEPESSSDDPDYDPSTGDLNDNERRKMKKKIHKRRSHDVLSSAQYLMPHDRIPAHLGVSTEERVSSENFSDKTATILNESPKYAHLREIVNEAAQQTLVDPSKKVKSSLNFEIID